MATHLSPFSLALLFTIITTIRGENILFAHFFGSYSHRGSTGRLAEALSNRGHNVTYISPHYPKEPNPNITEVVPIQVSDFNEHLHNTKFDISHRVTGKVSRVIDEILNLSYDSCEVMLASNEFKDWLKTTQKMDLVIVDNFLAECGIGLAHKLGAKYATFGTVRSLPYEYDALGYLPESSSVPELEVFPLQPPFGFFSRISNALMSVHFHFWHYLHLIKIDSLIRNSLNSPDMPFIGDLMRNVSLAFYTGDVFSDYPRALPPNFVNVAGVHCKEPSNILPEEIQKFIMNDTSDGFVYFSLGSTVTISELPGHIKNVFFETIRSFPKLLFLLKWTGDMPEEIPDNLFLGRWFPQADILGHPKIKAFITQCGRPSTLEAIFSGIPVITFPVLGDQDYNANRLQEIGAGIRLEIGEVTIKEFQDAIRKVVYDPSIKARMTKFQKLFRDRPMTPLDTAVWWTEYLLRNEDTVHLRPAGHSQNWLVRRQIDVWAFLTITIFVVTISFVIICTKIVKQAFNGDAKLKQS